MFFAMNPENFEQHRESEAALPRPKPHESQEDSRDVLDQQSRLVESIPQDVAQELMKTDSAFPEEAKLCDAKGIGPADRAILRYNRVCISKRGDELVLQAKGEQPLVLTNQVKDVKISITPGLGKNLLDIKAVGGSAALEMKLPLLQSARDMAQFVQDTMQKAGIPGLEATVTKESMGNVGSEFMLRLNGRQLPVTMHPTIGKDGSMELRVQLEGEEKPETLDRLATRILGKDTQDA